MTEELPGPGLAGRFTHELVRRALYGRLSGIRRAELHVRVAEALGSERPEDRAGVLRAGDIAREIRDPQLLARAAIGYEEACWRPGHRR